MGTELYFLRSSEAKIVTDMLPLAHEPNEQNIKKYTEFFGLKPTDLGLYALHKNKIAGAIWSREIDNRPTLSVAMLKDYRNQGIGSLMMNQFLLEAGAIYDEITIDAYNMEDTVFYERFGFLRDNSSNYIMTKKLQRKDVVRPSDGYDPKKWMD